MERLVIVGASYRHASVAALGTYAWPKAEVESRLPEMAKAVGAPELAYVGTCNRVEFVLAGDDGTSANTYRERIARVLRETGCTGEEMRKLRAWQGEGAAEHLLLVASGLDSARRGEPEIRAQVRAAWQSAHRAGTCGPILDRLFADALKTSAEVQGFISSQIGVMSLSDVAMSHVMSHVEGRNGHVAIVGVSPMTRRCAQILSDAGHRLTVASRTRRTAATLTEEIPGTPLTIDDLKRSEGPFDAIIAATGSGDVVLTQDNIAPWAKDTLLIVDFGVPANIDPAVADLPHAHLLDMDHLIDEARAKTDPAQPEMAQAREIVDQHLDRLRGEMALRRAGPAIRDVIAHYQAMAKNSINKELTATEPAEQEKLRKWADLMARRFMHTTLAGVRALAARGEPGAVDVFLRGLSESLPTESEQDTDKDGIL